MYAELLSNLAYFFQLAANATRALSRFSAATFDKVYDLQWTKTLADTDMNIVTLKGDVSVPDPEDTEAYAEYQERIAKAVQDRIKWLVVMR